MTPTSKYRDTLIARAQIEAEQHHMEDMGGGCTCGFCVWSVEHVLVMSMREALRGVGFIVPTTDSDR